MYAHTNGHTHNDAHAHAHVHAHAYAHAHVHVLYTHTYACTNKVLDQNDTWLEIIKSGDVSKPSREASKLRTLILIVT